MILVRTNNGGNFPVFGSSFDNVFGRDLLNDWLLSGYSSTNGNPPKVNIKENNNSYLVELAAPGMEKSDFQIELDNKTLRINSQKKAGNRDKGDTGEYSRREFYYQSFSKAFTLPVSADGEKVEAYYKNGILSISIPKKEESQPKPSKTITIS